MPQIHATLLCNCPDEISEDNIELIKRHYGHDVILSWSPGQMAYVGALLTTKRVKSSIIVPNNCRLIRYKTALKRAKKKAEKQ